MNKTFKAGILVAVLVIPAFLYIFLRFFTQNHYVLTRFYPLIDSTSNKPILSKQRNEDGVAINDTLFHTIPAFSLTDQDGKIVTDASIKGKIHVADFFFTRCSTICPKLSTQLSRVQDIFRNYPELVFLSFSVDPEHDQPEQLKTYATKYEAIPGRWHFLTGSKGDIYRLAQKGYYLPAVDAGVSNGNPDETFIHSEKLVLVDKAGIIRGYYDGTDKKDIERLILEIRVLMSNYDKQ